MLSQITSIMRRNSKPKDTPSTESAPSDSDIGATDVIVRNSDQDTPLVKRDRSLVKLDRKKEIMINGKKHQIDPRQLIHMIKNITQTIGEYKRSNNPMSEYVIHALRKARSEIVADLANTFNIHWQVDDAGKSTFVV